MRKILTLMAAAAIAAGAVSCSGSKTGKAPGAKKPAATEATTAETTAAETTTEAVTTTTAAVTTTAPVTTQPDPKGGTFEYNADGAVVFSEDASEADDNTLIAAAQALFESACSTQMSFTVGCPFKVDHTNYVENNFGWQFYRIMDDSIRNFKDVEAAYNKVFSSSYPNQLSELYIEENGAVYALCGNRGADLFFVSSKITGIKSKTDSEIVFTVENSYNGNDFGDPPYTVTDEFSAVIEDGNVWKAGKFTLPY